MGLLETRAFVLAVTLGVVGCSDVDWAVHRVTNSVEAAFSEPHRASLPRAAAPQVPSPSPSPWHLASAPSSKPQATSDATPVVVNGLSGKDVRALLGQPAKRDGPAPGETWTYKTGSCQVELFLFPDVTHGGMQVLDSRVNAGANHEDAKQACLHRLRDDQKS